MIARAAAADALASFRAATASSRRATPSVTSRSAGSSAGGGERLGVERRSLPCGVTRTGVRRRRGSARAAKKRG